VLDAALLLILLLGSIGGLWRGVRREIYVSVGLLLGYALAVSWADPWAADLRDIWSISSPRAHFLIAMALVVVPTLGIALLGPRVAERAPPDFAGRVGGAVLAIVNLVVAVALVGRWARQDLLGTGNERDVERTRLAGPVSEEIGLVLIGGLVAAVALLLGAVWVERRRQTGFRRATPLRAPDARVHRREQPVLAPEAEKVEPRATKLGGWAARSANRPTEATATAPLPVIHEASRNGGSQPSQSGSPLAAPNDDSERAQPPPPRGRSTSEWLTVASSERRSESVDRCLNCGERLTEDDRFCPRCGRSLV